MKTLYFKQRRKGGREGREDLPGYNCSSSVSGNELAPTTSELDVIVVDTLLDREFLCRILDNPCFMDLNNL